MGQYSVTKTVSGISRKFGFTQALKGLRKHDLEKFQNSGIDADSSHWFSGPLPAPHRCHQRIPGWRGDGAHVIPGFRHIQREERGAVLVFLQSKQPTCILHLLPRNPPPGELVPLIKKVLHLYPNWLLLNVETFLSVQSSGITWSNVLHPPWDWKQFQDCPLCFCRMNQTRPLSHSQWIEHSPANNSSYWLIIPLILLWIDYKLSVSLPQSVPDTPPVVPFHWPHEHSERRCWFLLSLLSTKARNFHARVLGPKRSLQI